MNQVLAETAKNFKRFLPKGYIFSVGCLSSITVSLGASTSIDLRKTMEDAPPRHFNQSHTHKSHRLDTQTCDVSLEVANRVLKRLRIDDHVWGAYPVDLALDALLDLYLATENVAYRDYVFSILFRRNIKLEEPVNYLRQPFGHYNYNLYLAIGKDKRVADAFVAESVKYHAEAELSDSGLVLHHSQADAPARVLIDSIHDYIGRMARTGALTGKSNYYNSAEKQATLHRALLRNPSNGLWSQGRGWENDLMLISPGAWSRGQGWLLKGFTEALDVIPREHPAYIQIRLYTQELLDALLPLQDPQGFWHALPHLPITASPPETSGTALIVAALYKCLAGNHIEATNDYIRAAQLGFEAIASSVTEDGIVRNACIGPGPLTQELLNIRYLGESFVEDKEHGHFAVLYACAARQRFLLRFL